jgi:serine/threonine protein kinase
MVMPLYGRSIETMVGRGKVFLNNDALWVGLDVSAALQSLHGAGIVHRDVKLANIMLHPTSELGRVVYVLGDFGVSNVLALASTCIGTPFTMAPELYSNRKYSSAVDMWSLGCCLYTLVISKQPFMAGSQRRLQMRVTRGLTPKQKDKLLVIAPSVGKMACACLAIPDRHRPTAKDMVTEIETLLQKDNDIVVVPDTSLDIDVAELQKRLVTATRYTVDKLLRPLPSKSNIPKLPSIVLNKDMLVIPNNAGDHDDHRAIGYVKHEADRINRRVSPNKRSLDGRMSPSTPKAQVENMPAPSVLTFCRGRDDAIRPIPKNVVMQENVAGVYPAIMRRPGRTHDFDTAKHYGSRVQGYKYLGKVYVTQPN